MGGTTNRSVPAIRVRQWMDEWNGVPYSDEGTRKRPSEFFFVFSVSAMELKALTGVQRRSADEGIPRSTDLRIQRGLEQSRSDEIREYVRFGYPWSEMTDAKRRSGDFSDLRKPGWLPTAIIVNILGDGDERQGVAIDPSDVIHLEEDAAGQPRFRLPDGFQDGGWKPKTLHPIEVIDGQHRLWAFENTEGLEDYELPVVAFHGLGLSWQAYLFWTINIKPKRINASLAFDLYPLLRTEDWLEKFHGHSIYRETRAQELTELLWGYEYSPWHRRINMLGTSGEGQPRNVTQASWIRSLMATFVKRQEARGERIGGLFGDPLTERDDLLRWDRVQQGAFLVAFGQRFQKAVRELQIDWTNALRSGATEPLGGANKLDEAFFGPHTLINTDQGIRGLLYLANDLCYALASKLGLREWLVDTSGTTSDDEAISVLIASLRRIEAGEFLDQLADRLATYDWRTSSAPGLTEAARRDKAALRGSGGYRLLRIDLINHLAGHEDALGHAARDVKSRMEF